jgi:NADH-quinone oxidoreductase subunit M
LAPLQHIWPVTNWLKVALFFSLSSLGCAVLLLNLTPVKTLACSTMDQPTQYLICTSSRWFSNAMILLTLALTIIIFSSFENEYKNAKAFYALILFGFLPWQEHS